MLGRRLTLIAVALLALPFVAGAAQTRTRTRTQARSGGVRPADAASECKDQQAASLARALAEGRDAPYGLDKKCDDPVPPPPPVPVPAPPPPAPPPPAPPPPPVPPPPPPGPPVNRAIGLVWEDIDGNGVRDPFAGEMGLAGWTVQLLDANGQVLSTQVSDPSGNFAFDALGIGTFSVCIVNPGGYTQTVPTAGTGCGGLGYMFSFVNNIGTWAINDFGEMANP